MDQILVPIGSIMLEAFLDVPSNSKAIVVFAHGAGSSRHSSRNQFVANVLQEAGFATLLFDLLTEKEDQIYENRFDIPLITKRLTKVTQWIFEQNDIRNLKIGYFGSSTGAASAMQASTQFKKKVGAVVSRGGRSDLAGRSHSEINCPTLFIAGGNDGVIIEMNKESIKKMNCTTGMEIIPDAGHLFEGPGELEQVAKLATSWFIKYLTFTPSVTS